MQTAATPLSQAVLPPVADQELAVLTEIGQVLSSTLDLREVFGKMMQIISDKLNMRRGTLILLDESTGRLRTEAALGLSSEDIDRNRFALGEGVTGNVVRSEERRVGKECRSRWS